MRLIDADALSEELSTLTMTVIGLRAAKGVLFEFMKEYRNSVLKVVDKQSTIDPESLRPKGEWIMVDFAGTVKCPVCGELNGETNFCPNCGADMRGEKE